MNPGYRGPAGGNVNNRPAGNFGGDKKPKGYEIGELQQFDTQQTGLYDQLFSHLGPDSYLSKLAGGDQSLFNEIESPALQQFSGLQGNIASRFSGMGMGARNSSGFQNTMNQASSDFAQQLQSQRQGLRSQALKELMEMSNMLLGQRPQERGLFEKPQHQMSTSSQFGLGALKATGDIASGYFGG